LKYRHILENFCSDYDYIAAAGLTRNMIKGETKKQLAKYIFSMTRDKIKVHGLAVTNQELIKNYPFYSVDSTTWLNGAIYGEYHEFENGKIIKNMSIRRILRTKDSKKLHLNCNAGTNARIKAGIISHIKLEKYITEIWKRRGIEWK